MEVSTSINTSLFINISSPTLVLCCLLIVFFSLSFVFLLEAIFGADDGTGKYLVQKQKKSNYKLSNKQTKTNTHTHTYIHTHTSI